MRHFEGCPGENGGWPGDQRGAGQLPNYRLADRLLPPRFGLAVIHQQVAEAQAPGCAKIQHPPTDSTLEDNGSITERAERHGNGYSSNGIVHNLVPDKQLNGIRACVTADLKVDDRFIRFEPGICLIDRDEPGSIERGNPVFRWPSRENLIIMDTMFAKVGLEFYRSELRRRLRRQQFTGGGRETCKRGSRSLCSASD